MKQYLKIILFSCIVGTALAGIFFIGIKDKTNAKNKTTVYLFQIGAFKNIDNANKIKEKYSYAKVVKNQDYYRVIVGATITHTDLLKYKFDNDNISYYIKEVNLDIDKFEEIEKYDVLLLKTDDIDLVLSQVVEILPDEL